MGDKDFLCRIYRLGALPWMQGNSRSVFLSLVHKRKQLLPSVPGDEIVGAVQPIGLGKLDKENLPAPHPTSVSARA